MADSVELVRSAADWRGPELARRTDWVHPFTPVQLDEVDAALARVEAAGLGLAEMTRKDFPLEALADGLAEMREALQSGPGIQLYTGFPVARYSPAQLRLIYWGLGLHIGTALPQSRHGDVMGDVRDIGGRQDSLTGRSYTSNEELHFHSDGCDVISLFCVQTAKSGGLSRAVSVVAIHNEMARRRPDLVAELYKPLCYSFRGQGRPDDPPFYEQPMFAVVDGKFVSRYSPAYLRYGYEAARRAMPPAQREAFEMARGLADDPDFYLERPFAPGDIVLINNLRVLHARTGFVDHDDPARKRHLLRLWLAVPNSPRLPESFKPFYRDVRPGAVRGGNPTELRTFETEHVE